ncbi:MAG: fibronectin type III domain-containing protein [Bacteroidales bacterium]
MKKFLIYMFVIFCTTSIAAQTYNMPTTGHQEETSSNCTLYDDGGANNNYSINSDASFTINATNEGSYFTIIGTYNLDICAKTRLVIYDGGTTSNTILGTYCGGNSTINICSRSSRVTVRFFSDTDTPLPGFNLNFVQIDCPRPTTFSSSNITTTSATLNWTGPDNTTWIVECTSGNMPNSQNIFTVNSMSLQLTGLCPYKDYCFTIRSDCLPIIPCSYLQVCFRTLCPCPKALSIFPYIENGNMEIDWIEPDTTIVWTVTLSYSGVTSVITTTNPNCIFPNIPNGLTTYCVTVNTNCNGCNDTNLSCNSTTLCVSPPPPPPFECSCPIAQNPVVSNVQTTSVDINWNSNQNATGWIIEYYPQFSTQKIYDTVHTNSCTLTNLQPATYYLCYIHSYCDNLDYRCASSCPFFTYNDNCFDFLDLRGPNCSTNYGSYDDPNTYRGLIDFGPESMYSRHTVHNDTTETDPMTNNMLKTVPSGEIASVRLGNWDINAQAESINYTYLIDTTNFDLLILNYAIVLQDPNHTVNNQPRFTLSIWGENGRILDQICGYTNFYASGELGWNSVPETNVIWKDWSTMGVDLGRYHGQTITIRLTSYDCSEGGHFGYGYFTLKCGSKYETQRACGSVDSIPFTAPFGFYYSWYKDRDEENIISTQRKISVLVDNSVFYCKCTSKENEYCNLFMKYVAERNYPFAQMNYEIDSCTREVTFINRSIVSNNDSIPIGEKHCGDIKWIFHDGTESNLDTIKFTYDSLGVYPIMLIANLNNGDCVDTLIQNITIGPYYIDTIKAYICKGETYESNGFNESEDGIYSINYITERGCDSLIVLDLNVYDKYLETFYDSICEGEAYSNYGFNCSNPGVYNHYFQSINGCDSIVILNLYQKQLYPDYSMIENKYIIVENFPIIIDVSCDGCYAYYWNTGSTNPKIEINQTGSYYVTIYTGCGNIYDSLLVVLPEINIYFPNAFTPLKPSNNTFFPIYDNNGNVFLESFEIYNRWGTKIYSSKTKGWDGKYNGKECYSGIYIWKLIYKTKFSENELFEKIGEVNLIR